MTRRAGSSGVRSWGARLVAAALLATTLGLATAQPASAVYDATICDFPPGAESLFGPIAKPDGDVLNPYSTTWNTPLTVTTSTVLDNDGMDFVLDGFTLVPGRLRAVVWRQPTHGTVRLTSSGSWTFTPSPPGPSLPAVFDSFEYVAFDPLSGLCSDPATVTLRVSGFTDPPVGLPPRAFGESYPADGSSIANTARLTVPEPGLLSNDVNGISNVTNSNLVARLVSPPVWLSNGLPAGEIVDWGKRDDRGTTVFDESGGFTFVPTTASYGTAIFTYKACYYSASAVYTPCSEPATVRIEVTGSNGARPFEKVVGPEGQVTVTAADLAANTTIDSTGGGAYPEILAMSRGIITDFETEVTEAPEGESKLVFRSFKWTGPFFPTATETISYRVCNAAKPGPFRVCTDASTISLRPSTVTPPPPPPGPKVDSISVVKSATDPIRVHFDDFVTGAAGLNLHVNDPFGPGSSTTDVPLVLTCTSTKAPGSFVNCQRDPFDTAILTPVAPWVIGRTYSLRVNLDETGIVGANADGLAVVTYERMFRVDSGPPVASPVATRSSGTWGKDDVTVTWNWYDGLGNGIDANRCTRESTSSGEGAQTLTATCTDLSGQTGTATYAVKVDRTPPTAAPVLSVAENTAGWVTSGVSVAWNWSDGSGSGIDPASCTTSSTPTVDGLLSLAAACKDKAGNTALAQTSLQLDRSAPAATPAVTPAPSNTWNRGDVTVTWNWADSASGLDPAACPATSTVTGEGASLVTATCKDKAGNSGFSSRLVRIDKTAPTAAPTLSAPGLFDGIVTVTWHWADDEFGSGTDASQCAATSKVDEAAVATLIGTCTDLAGNVGRAPARVAPPDTTAPTAAPTGASSEWSKSDVTVTWHWTDGTGWGIDPSRCPATSTSTGEGAMTLTGSCTDLAGNTGYASAPVKVDKTAPTAAPTGAGAGWSKSDVTVTWNWNDTASGLDAAACPATSVVTTEGTSLVTATCKDKAGNSASSSRTVRIDKTAPTAAPTLSAPSPSGGLVTVTWHWSDGASGSGTDPGACPDTTTVAGSAVAALTGTCADLAGNVGRAPAWVAPPDTAAPTAAPTGASAAWSKGDVTVTWHWTDGTGSGIDPARCPATTTSSGEGALTLTATCTDLAGNTGTASAAVKVDKTPPVLAPKVAPSPLLLGAVGTATPGATDARSGVATSSCGTVDTTALGARTVSCTATDQAGNTATVAAPYTVGVGVRWVLRPVVIWPTVGTKNLVVVQLTDAKGRLVPARAASRLPACAVRIKLADQAPVCATYLRVANAFTALTVVTKALPRGTVNLTATVTSGGALLGTTTAPVTVLRR